MRLVGLAVATVVAAATVTAAAPAYADSEADAISMVVSVEQNADGTVTETIYTPAEGVSNSALAAGLSAQGVANVSVVTDAEVTAQVAACSLGSARTFPSSATCFVRWSKNGAVRPVIDFVDYSTSEWPVGRAVTEWNKTSGIDSIYRPSSKGCDGAPAHCVNVYSGDYGATGWVGLTQMVFNSAQTYFTKASVSLNDHYGGNTQALHWNPACHELGHVLGLGHNVSTASCMYYRQSSNKYPTSEDRGLLERYY